MSMNAAPNQTAIAVLNEYPPSKFNLLIPVKTMQEISPLHKVVINQALASPKMANKKPVSRCSYLSCQHHYLDNWTGRCRLDLAYVRGQGACESYIKKDFGANAPVPKWYSRNQKERR